MAVKTLVIHTTSSVYLKLPVRIILQTFPVGNNCSLYYLRHCPYYSRHLANIALTIQGIRHMVSETVLLFKVSSTSFYLSLCVLPYSVRVLPSDQPDNLAVGVHVNLVAPEIHINFLGGR